MPLALTFCLFLPTPVLCDDESVRVAVAGLATNIESFQQYRCTYQITKGCAASVEDARQRRWTDTVTSKFKLLVNGEHELFVCEWPPIDPKSLKSNGKGGWRSIIVPFSSHSFLRSKDLQLRYSPNSSVAGLGKSEWVFEAYTGATPLDMGIMGDHCRLAPHMMQVRPELFEFGVEPDRQVGSTTTAVSTFKFGRGSDNYWLKKFFLDPSQGYLPLKYEKFFTPDQVRSGSPKVVVELIAARQCKNDRWFPDRVLEYVRPDGVSVLTISRIFRCLNLRSIAMCLWMILL